MGQEPVDASRESTTVPAREEASRRSRWRDAIPSDRLTQFGVAVVLALLMLAVFGPFVSPYDPVEQDLQHQLEAPSVEHPLGTDQLGRDVLTRLLHGARLSLGVAAAVTAVRLVVGTAVGLVAGYAGGWVDEALMRLVDTLLAFPGIILALVIAGVLGPSLVNVMLALAVVGWASYARLVRSSVLSLREREFVTAARLLGRSRMHVVTRHLIPNVVAPVVVLATLDIGGVILGTAGLSFLGLGAQPPTPEWGTMLASGRNYLREAWWLVNAPGVLIMLTVFGFNLLGDSLRDALSPTQSAQLEQL
ncbi:ABC transporter permease (plasmid) [Haloferax mediterranei ATCC 33500]|uniref:ABC transporter permease n=1 Tax=Haloferax mediterranei (strain ATCC 33500 / DSM 1411 / JCM 8866 / NBRC 14739 / NCIMB 2177 / R-4) TaxID=523841 RepID=M0JAL5_HALMT|nr:nickel transporter permease [Haloferax mediterranei]AHZ24312.1 peptide ABC transporter permease [Haloferax mediterranei ATCC 33500]EMA05398.1 ABC-type dipeptide/oligopeptide/nickel transport system, permease protein II [Haloferax mediterranei ATCC 33500]QCQ77367.1 ABC transporter permease [Haloferax mediterranei ATCC 33500]